MALYEFRIIIIIIIILLFMRFISVVVTH